MKREKNKDWFNYRVLAVLSCVGLVLTAILFAYFKKNHIYEHEYGFGRTITILFFVGFVILPVACCVSLFLFEKVISPLIYKIFYYRHQQRIEKYGLKKILREQRINKVISSFMISFIFSVVCSINLFLLLILGIGSLLVPKFGEVPIVLFLVIIAVFMLLISLLCSVICVRYFINKKGKAKALKYVVNLKKKPGPLGRTWLKSCGFNQQDIRMYLEKLNL